MTTLTATLYVGDHCMYCPPMKKASATWAEKAGIKLVIKDAARCRSIQAVPCLVVRKGRREVARIYGAMSPTAIAKEVESQS